MNTLSFNELLQHSMKTDRNPLKVKCTDKLGVKEYVEQVVGPGHTPLTYVTGNNVKEVLKKISPDHPKSYYIKANNDSGGTALVRNSKYNINSLSKVSRYQNKPYIGVNNGEWFYKNIKYKVFTEEILGDNMTDYKFHCSNGEVRFCQVIRDRNHGKTNEVCVDTRGQCHDFHFDTQFKLVKSFDIPANWELMLDMAKKLCKPFDYVRVDMYNTNPLESSDKCLFIGELTFAPRAGRYPGKGQIEAGKLLT